MLKNLHIRDFLLVRALDVAFQNGLTVITGESGAGKSIILGALGLVLGDRANADTLRPGAARAEITAEFDLGSASPLHMLLHEQSLDDPDQPGRCLVRRTLTSDGRSKAFINGTPVNLRQLKALTGDLVDVHGQNEHQRLADPEVQLALLDDYGVDKSLLGKCRLAFVDWRQTAKSLSDLRNAVRDSEDRTSLLTYQLEELSQIDPQPGEFANITREHKRQSQAQLLLDHVHQALEVLEEDTALAQALGQLERLDDEHPALSASLETLRSALALADDTTRDLKVYERTLEHDPQALQSLDRRLSELHELARKHRVEPDDLARLMRSLHDELESMSTDRSALETLEVEQEQQEKAYRKLAARISKQRRASADSFASAVTDCMRTLGISEGTLSLAFTPCEAAHGVEKVEFLCVTNPKFSAAPLAKVASGGEQARISLAIQTVAAQKSQLPTLVLDEADVGVGGTTADVVGRLLRGLARRTQVLCVTHAPQVAALGEQHMRVHKDEEQDTRIDPLPEGGRIDELARMLAGSGITKKSRDYARSLLKEASDNPVH
jgi:DNA repair protein RecN (Recombination protein N)